MRAGAVVIDRFEIGGLAGSGGMGTVWRARDRLLGVDVAMKILTGTREGERARFLREAVLLSQLRHPAIVEYVSHGVTPRGELFLAMEWLDGQDLWAFLQKRRLDVAQTVALLGRVLDALTVAHARGVIHRDIKPSNIFLVAGSIDAIKLIDFGVARVSGLTTGSHARTETGTIVGTPGYMPPEQAFGEKNLDARVDLFALGCVAFECLAGRPAYVGESPMAVLRKILVEEPPRLRDVVSGVPRWLDTLIHRMMAREPEKRPSDAASLAAELAAAGPVDAATTTDLARMRREARLVTVIVVGSPPGADAYEPSLESGAPESDAPMATRRVARVEMLELPSTGGNAIDAAVDAARRAATLRASFAGRRLDLVTYRREEGGSASTRESAPPGPVETNAAPSVGIVVDETTADILDLHFHVEPTTGGAVLRGERDELESRVVAGKATPCLGRDRELAALEATFAECRDEPVARAALVTAPAGAGKSRLRRELEQRLRRAAGDESPSFEVWWAHAQSSDAHNAYALLARLIRFACGIVGDDTVDAERAKLEARVARRVPAGERERVLAGLGRVLEKCATSQGAATQVTAPDDAIDDALRAAWVDFIAAECATAPLLLVLDDLHRADADSLRSVDAALDCLKDLPLMVVGLGRPELHDHFPRLWADRGARDVRLGPLSNRASERLAREVLNEGVDPAVVAYVVGRAAGNAFFLEEISRAAVAGESATPRTVLAVVAADIAAVPADGRRVLRAASLLGPTFSREGVAALLADPDVVGDWLPDLEQRGLLVKVATGASGTDEEQFTFRSELLREAAYETLTRADRALGRRLADEWLETKVPDRTISA